MGSRRALSLFAAAALLAVPVAGFETTVTARAAAAATAPGAPRWPYALQWGSTAAKVVWTAPASTGGSLITGYVVTPYKAGVALAPRTYLSPKTTEFPQNLTTGKAFRFTVAAINAVGTGPVSTMTATIFIGAPGQPPMPYVSAYRPGQVRVHVFPPANNGAYISLTTARCASSDGGVLGVRTAGEYSHILTLTVGKTYTCKASATNSRGTGIWSPPSAPFVVT
jgi:hypothetical protein